MLEIALCHRIPREIFFFLTLLLLLISLIFQALSVGLRYASHGGGEFKVVNPENEAVLWWARLNLPSGIELRNVDPDCDFSSTLTTDSSSCSYDLCSFQLTTFDGECVRYLTSFREVEICVIIGLAFSILSFLYCLFFSWGKTLIQVNVCLFSALCLPCGFLCAALILFFVSVVPNGKDVIHAYASSQRETSSVSSVNLFFSRGVVTNLYICSCCFCFTALLLVLCHGIWLIFLKDESVIPDEELVKDDYLLQREVLTRHAEAVRAEIKHKGEIDPAFIQPLSSSR